MDATKVDTAPLRERNRQRTHERIVKAAFELFRDQGYDRTTMDEIALNAEVSRATLFNYFPAKDYLLGHYIRQVLEDKILPGLLAYLADQPHTIDAFRHLFMSVYENVLHVPEIGKAIWREFLRTMQNGTFKDPDSDLLLLTLRDLVQYGIDRGEVRAGIPPEHLASYVGALYGSVVLNILFKTGISDYPHEIENLLQFIFAGLQP